MRRSHLPITCLVAILSWCCYGRANPVGIHVPSAFREAIQGTIAGSAADSDTALVELLGGGNIRFMEDDIWALLEGHFDHLAPLIVKSQSPPFIIDEHILEWYWQHADATQREEMLLGLRSWLTAGLSDSVGYTAWGLKADLREEWSRVVARVNAAEFLVDYHDQSALPLIDSLRDSLAAAFGGVQSMPEMWIEPWWYLYQAGLRIQHPELAVLCRLSDDGRVDFGASPADIKVARYVDFFVDNHPEMPVELSTAARIVGLVEDADFLGRCRERGRAPCAARYDGVMVQVSDGREMTLSYGDDGVIVCSDNTRYFRWAYKLRQPALLSILQEIHGAFVAEAPGFPMGEHGGATGMPN